MVRRTQHDERLAAFAKAMRREPTDTEKHVWRHLSGRKLAELKFRRQHVFGRYIVDFYCPVLNLVVEIDGHMHDLDCDAARDNGMVELGATVLRFTNEDVRTNFEGVLETIAARAVALSNRNGWRRPDPPQPLPQRGGA